MPHVPESLYDPADSLTHGVIRSCGYLLRLRMEYLLERFDEPVGLRRATHVGALIEVVYISHQVNFTTGFFSKELKEELDHALETAHLQDQEQHFAKLEWWNKLDREKAREELASNLDRLIADDVTTCLRIGIEMHVLFDIRMHTAYTDYRSVITPERKKKSQALRESIERFEKMFAAALAA